MNDEVIVVDGRIPPALFLDPRGEVLVIRSRRLSMAARLIFVQLLEVRNFRRTVGKVHEYLMKLNGISASEVSAALAELETFKLLNRPLGSSDTEIDMPWELPWEILEGLGWKPMGG